MKKTTMARTAAARMARAASWTAPLSLAAAALAGPPPGAARATLDAPVPSDCLGTAVAVDGDRVVATIPWRLPPISTPGVLGMCAIFEKDGSTWTQVAVVTSPATGDGFGSSVAIDGDVLLVGAPRWSASTTNLAAGRYHVFRRGGDGVWTQVAQAQGATRDALGCAVAAHQGHAIVGSRGYSGPAAGAGRVLFLSYTGDSVEPTGSITGGGLGNQSALGTSVALWGEWSAASATPTGSTSGVVWMFRRATDGVWSAEQQLVPPASFAGDGFGLALAMADDLVAVGAPAPGQVGAAADGAVHLYRLVQGVWQMEETLVAPDPAACAGFGTAVAVSDGQVVVGAAEVDPADPWSGGMFRFRKEGERWVLVGASQGDQEAAYGTALASRGGTLVVAAPGATLQESVPNQGFVDIFTTLLPGDLNGDGVVNGLDLGILLAAWSPAPPEGSPADLNGDGQVNGADLAILIGAWS